jgi:hypothetical protein
MKIDESYKDLKSLLNLDKIMNKIQVNMEKMVALMLIAYAIGLLLGESIRDCMYGPPKGTASVPQGKYWKLYSGLFVLLKQKILLPHQVLEQVVSSVQDSFACLVRGNVRCSV